MHTMVDEAINILQAENGDIDDFGRLLHEAWRIKRGLNDAVTTSDIDNIYERARKAGAIGGKLLGAGQGGFMLIYVAPEVQSRVREALADLIYVPFKFESFGSQIIQNGK